MQVAINDSTWMNRALDLAERAQGRVAPNPAVGALLVRDDEVVGSGWTCPPGGDHAEIVALRQAGMRAAGATLYVTLEPCAHFGRTPPCADALVRAGIARAVVAVSDPFPEVNGRGIARLRDAGIEVTLGVGAERAVALNAGFFTRVLTGLPEVTAKFAVSLDGRIATRTSHSRWITGPEARHEAHRLRDRHDAILVGIGTVLADDPLLTTRLPGDVHHPLRVVLDSAARTPTEAAILRPETPGRTLIAVTERATPVAVERLRVAGAEVVTLPARDGRVDPEALLRELARRGVNSLLVEGGGQVHGALFDARLVDRVVAFVAPTVVGGTGAPGPIAGLGIATMDEAPRLTDVEVRAVGADVMIAGRVTPLPDWEGSTCSAASSRRSATSSPTSRVVVTTP